MSERVQINGHVYTLEYVTFCRGKKIDLYLYGDVTNEQLYEDLQTDDFKNIVSRETFKNKLYSLEINGHVAQNGVPSRENGRDINKKIYHIIKGCLTRFKSVT